MRPAASGREGWWGRESFKGGVGLRGGKTRERERFGGVQPGEEPRGLGNLGTLSAGRREVTRGTHRCVPGSICPGGWARSSDLTTFLFLFIFYLSRVVRGGANPGKVHLESTERGGRAAARSLPSGQPSASGGR